MRYNFPIAYGPKTVFYDLPNGTDRKLVVSNRISLGILDMTDNKLARYTCIPRSLSVSDNMTRLERKKFSIDEYCNNKRARYTCIAREWQYDLLRAKEIMNRLE